MKSGLTIKRINFEGLEAIELRTTALRLVAITARGPRVAFLADLMATIYCTGLQVNIAAVNGICSAVIGCGRRDPVLMKPKKLTRPTISRVKWRLMLGALL